MSDRQPRSEEEVQRLKDQQKTPVWRAILWIYPRRPLLTAGFLIGVLIHSWLSDAETARPITDPSFRSALIWLLLLIGAGVRIWGSGNLRKNEEITQAGVYAIVRHPLYFGSLTVFLGYFIGVGDPWVGAAWFAWMVALVYYPTMLAEEDHLRLKFPGQFSEYRPPPRLLPDPRRFGPALRTDRFSLGAAYRNLGLRSAWALVIVPVGLEILARLS